MSSSDKDTDDWPAMRRALLAAAAEGGGGTGSGSGTGPIEECIKGCAEKAGNIQEYQNCVSFCKQTFPRVTVVRGVREISVIVGEEARE
jgi:hypothetical protein